MTLKKAVSKLSKTSSTSLSSIIEQQKLTSKELLSAGIKRKHGLMSSFLIRNKFKSNTANEEEKVTEQIID